jgi:hypothetical protein
MTRVYGQLFEDKRNGFLVVKPSKPFFGCDRHESQYKVVDGYIDIQLQPTPRDTVYLIGFKEEGDIRRTDFTLKWRINNTNEVDVSPKSTEPVIAPPSVRSDQVQVRRLATELSTSMQRVSKLEDQLRNAHRQLDDLSNKFQVHRANAELSLVQRDEAISQLQTASDPEVQTVIKHVPVPPAALAERISFLEQEVTRLKALNDHYYESVVELHQLKLDKAQSITPSVPITSPEDTPRQRLLNKLLAK